MAFIKKLKDVNENTIYPQTHTEAVYDASGVHLQSWMDRYVTAEEIGEKEEIDINFENQGNKVTVIDENSTNIQYPSAKATYDLIVNNLSNLGAGIKIEVVNVLPAIANADSQSIYLVPAETSEDGNIYNEYLLVNNAWEHLGTTKVDLSNYYTKTETDGKYAKLSLYGDTTINIGRNPKTTIGLYSVAEGSDTIASGNASHAEGIGTNASGHYSHVEGKYNIASTSYAHIVGNGSSSAERSNAHTLDWNGNAWYQGDIYVGSTSGINKDEGSKKLATEEYVNNLISSSITATLEASY